MTGPYEPEAVAASMAERGYAVLPGFLTQAQLEEADRFVREAVGRSRGEYVGFDGASQLAGTTFDEIARSEALLGLLRGLWSARTGTPPPDQDVYHILRCLSGVSGQANSLRFHYDSYVVTALVPVSVPTRTDASGAGDLLLLPKRRPIRRTYPRNVLDKIMIENAVSQRRLKRCYATGGLIRIGLRPGHLVLFWGYETGHTNEACDPRAIRATAIYHFGEPHRDARSRRLADRFRRTLH